MITAIRDRANPSTRRVNDLIKLPKNTLRTKLKVPYSMQPFRRSRPLILMSPPSWRESWMDDTRIDGGTVLVL